MAVSLTSTGVVFNDSTTQTSKFTSSFPSGTYTIFNQTAAPTGWTRQTTHNNKALRVISGATAGSGGTVGFSTVLSNQSLGGTTLTLAQIASHRHGGVGNLYGYNPGFSGGSWTHRYDYTMGATGGSTAHTHTVNIAVNYVDVIVALKS